MAFRVANSGESIPAKFDGALRSTYANAQDYIVEGVGNEFQCTYANNSLQVTVGTGVANISGRGISAEESNSITLNANATTYLCLRIDLTETVHHEGKLYANTSSTIANDNLSNTNGIHDLLLAIVTTNSSEITSLVDRRDIKSQARIAYVLPTATASTLGGVKIGNNVAIENGVIRAKIPKVGTQIQEIINSTGGVITSTYTPTEDVFVRTASGNNGNEISIAVNGNIIDRCKDYNTSYNWQLVKSGNQITINSGGYWTRVYIHHVVWE